MDTYLITGGAGFIGSNYIRYLLERYNSIKIICLDKLTYAGNIANIESELISNKNRLMFIKGDICNQELVQFIFANYPIKYVVNFAAESHVDRSILDADLFLKTNIFGVQNLLKFAKNTWQLGEEKYLDGVRFLQVSTDEVYGSSQGDVPFTEDHPLKPNNPYSASKAGGDLLVRSYIQTFKFPALITRCSNNYGPYQFPEKFIPLMINNILKGANLPIYGDGKNIRDWLHVKDHCRAIDLVLRKGTLGETYNISGQNEITNIQLVEILLTEIKTILKRYPDSSNITQVDPDRIGKNLITFVKDRPGHDKRYSIDSTKIRKELGWEPSINFREGLKSTIKWYLDNQNWLQTVTRGGFENYYRQMYANR